MMGDVKIEENLSIVLCTSYETSNRQRFSIICPKPFVRVPSFQTPQLVQGQFAFSSVVAFWSWDWSCHNVVLNLSLVGAPQCCSLHRFDRKVMTSFHVNTSCKSNSTRVTQSILRPGVKAAPSAVTFLTLEMPSMRLAQVKIRRRNGKWEGNTVWDDSEILLSSMFQLSKTSSSEVGFGETCWLPMWQLFLSTGACGVEICS